MGCETQPEFPGNDDAWIDAIRNWVLVGAGIGALLSYLNIAGAAPLVISGAAATLATLAVIFGALAAGTFAGFLGYAVEWSRRLKEQNPRTISITALVDCAAKNSGVPPVNDGDWTFNVGEPWAVTAPTDAGLDMDVVRTRAAPDSGLSVAFKTFDPERDPSRGVFHVEISSNIGDFGAVGAPIGSAAGLIAGIIIGAIACAAIGVLTLGLGFALCALIIAALAFVGALLGGFAGAAVGGFIGWIADQFSDFEERGKAVEEGSCMFLTGRWVTDISHQHNEIHDLESAVIIECGMDSGAPSLTFAGAVGTGRHPQGPDP